MQLQANMPYLAEVEGIGGIVARIVAKSYNPTLDQIITTWELEYPRIIHGEFMTHRRFSRNAASSRAIPITKVLEQVANNPATPVHWGKNQPGMQAKEQLTGLKLGITQAAWLLAAKASSAAAWVMHKMGAHKQVANRVLEAYQFMKVVMTTTDINNWYWLRDHEDADPTIHELARCMREADTQVTALTLDAGEWHMPYYRGGYWDAGCEESLEDALKISSSCCAQASFRTLDTSLEKARRVYQRLVDSEPVHASPFEHQATPITQTDNRLDVAYWQQGITHVDRDGIFWSGNFKGWVQHRQLIPNNYKA